MKSWTFTLALLATLAFAAAPLAAEETGAATPAADAALEAQALADTAEVGAEEAPAEAPEPPATPEAEMPADTAEPAEEEAAAVAPVPAAPTDSPWAIETGLDPAAPQVADDAVSGAAVVPGAVDGFAEAATAESEATVPAPPAPVADAAGADDVIDAASADWEALEASAAATPPPASPTIESGAVGRDERGTPGRIHVVARGDTLWDIAAAYLRTPWVWPAIWNENEDIENPHRIYPGDHIWISDTEMRRVTRSEAAELIAAETGEPVEILEDPELPLLGGLAAMEEAQPIPLAPARRVLQRTSIPGVGDMSFVNEEKLSAATSIVSSGSPRTWVLEGDEVVLGLGEGETTVGARYDVFRDAVPVRAIDSDRVVGYHVEILGWVEVKAVHGDSSTAEIRTSKDGILRGDRVIEREEAPREFELTPAPPDLDARIVFTPMDRTQLAQLDYVYIDKGSVHGIEVGTEVQVYESGKLVDDRVRHTVVRAPERAIAELVVVSVQPTTSVGFVMHSRRELHIGDRIRPTMETLAMR